MKKIFLLSSLVLFLQVFLIFPVYTQNQGENSGEHSIQGYLCEEDWIEVMFTSESKVRMRYGNLVDLATRALQGTDQVLNVLEWHQWHRITDVPESTIDSWEVNGERNTGKDIYNLNNIYRLQIPKGKDVWNICKQLQALQGIERAMPVPKPVAPPSPPPGSYQSLQGYLNPATNNPSGVDALWSWTQTGGTGAGVTVCDLEYSWNYNHADITKAVGSQINPNPLTDPFNDNNHGTAVIGELVADNNGWGTTGICYGSNLKTCGTVYAAGGGWNVAGALSYAIAGLSTGDIILLEQQWDYSNLPNPHPGQEEFIPIEWWGSNRPSAQTNNAVYAAIVNAIANGIHVVEAGGNGNNVTGINTGLLTWFGNSGAIIVGAGGATTLNDRQRLSFSSYGSRFNLQGWGENVFTTGYGAYYNTEGVNYYYTSTFNGTSSASPVVAGALACTEGYYLVNVSSTPPTPSYMRTHLATYGTAQVYGPSGNIGPRPNIKAAIQNFPSTTYDFGDAPPPYPTLLSASGARHANTGLRLGTFIDSESDGQPTVAADGDDLNPIGSNNDEDGVIFTGALIPGQTVTIQVTASTQGILNAWIDFNNINVWSDPGEFIFQNQTLYAGINVLNFFVPANASPGYAYARFRLNSTGGILFYGLAPDGEVEDYRVFIEESEGIDWGDAPDGPYPTLSLNNGAHHTILTGMFLGNLIDGEQDGQPDPLALGDDNNPPGLDDEDGIMFTSTLQPGNSATVNIVASMPGWLNAWCDFNQSNGWADPGELILANIWLNPGMNSFAFPVPPAALPGTTFARFRYSNLMNLSYFGYAPDGEVEDYNVIIVSGTNDIQIDPDPGHAYVQNEISMALIPGTQPGKPSILLAAYNDDPYPGGPGLGVSYSNDGGTIWNPLQLPYPPDPYGGGNFLDAFDPTATADANGNLYVAHISTDYNWSTGPASGLFVHKSTDGGVTWNAPVAIATDGPPSGSPDPNYRFNDRCQMTADVNPASPFYNNLYIVEIKDRGWNMPQPYGDIYFSSSTDGGATWSSQVILNGMQSNMANMPVPAIASDGTIYVCWMDYNVLTGGTGTIYIDVSTNGGITWLSNDIFVTNVNLPPLRLNGGTDVLAKGAAVIRVSPFNSQEIYITYAEQIIGSPDEADIFFRKSTDGGSTWIVQRVNDDNSTNDQVLPWMDIKPDGTIDIAWYDRRNDPADLNWDVYFTVSLDGGNTFIPNQKINNVAAPSPNTPVSGFWMGEYLGLVVDATHAYFGFTSSILDINGDVFFSKMQNPVTALDFGDAPDPMYPTKIGNNGARHIMNGVTCLGATIDAENDGQPDPNALGDDNNLSDDEDGVVFMGPLLAGSPAIINITASNNGLLNLWIDYDGDGTWSQANEHIFFDFGLSAGVHDLNFLVPMNVMPGITFARFRFSNQPALSYTGLASDGEVEDYEVIIEENPDIKWQQLPNTNLPGLHVHDANIPPYQSIVIADDWLCNGGMVTDIHWWGNYELDGLGIERKGAGISHFHLSIHNDDPTGTCLPLDPEVWGFNIPFNAITEQPTGMFSNDGSPIYLYEFVLPVPFDQIAGNRYWLDISAFSIDPNNQAIWRWQEAQRTYFPILCGAASKIDPGILPWSTIQWNPTPPYMYSDMAFIITSSEVPVLDLGDLPDGPYPTFLSSNGPSHLVGSLFMGNQIDPEFDGQPQTNALGDDLAGIDDEDGVAFIGGIFPGQVSYISVNVSQGNGYLQGWFDYNADGDFGDAGEQIFTDLALPVGSNILTFIADPNATIGITFARFRISTVLGLGYNGPAPDGEVEDYEVIIRNPLAIWHLDENAGTIAFDATSYQNDGTINGATWTSGFSNSALSFNGSSDEVTVLHSPSLDITGQFSVQAWIKSSGTQNYYAIVDKYEYNSAGSKGFTFYINNGKLRFSIYSGSVGSADLFGTTELRDNTYHNVMASWDGSFMNVYVDGNPEGQAPWTNPPASTTQSLGIGMRLSGWGGTMPFNGIIDEVIISGDPPPLMDFGDANDPNYPTLYVNDGARHIINGITYLGFGVDPDLNGQPDLNALGDDNNGTDDEDGVSLNPFSSAWTPGGIVWLDVVASTNGILNAWVDYDANGSWGDPGERIIIDQAVNAGTNGSIISIPLNAQIGKTIARFRLSTLPGLSFTGLAIDGEVEDYQITMEGDVDVGLRVFLEGPYVGPNMSTTLNTLGYLPLGQPYNADPLAVWYYNGTESVPAIPNTNITDWVLVEFRDAPSAAAATRATMISMQPAFIMNNGMVIGLDGISPLKVSGVFQYNPYVVIWHRNHLGVLSAVPLILTGINQYSYDFTTGAGQAYLNGHKDLGGGVYGMFGADGAPNQLIDQADKTTVWVPQVGIKGYKAGDFNLNGHVNNPDKNNVWVPNLGQGTKVP
jgi:hypothetical protein